MLFEGRREEKKDTVELALRRSGGDQTEADQLVRSTAFGIGAAAYACVFLRTGFQEVVSADRDPEDSGWEFATRSMTRRIYLSHTATLSLPLHCEMHNPESTAEMGKLVEDRALQSAIEFGPGPLQGETTDAAAAVALFNHIDTAVNSSASLDRANALGIGCMIGLPLSVVECLLERGASVKNPDPNWGTLLMLAARTADSTVCVRNWMPEDGHCLALVGYGADRDLTDNDGRPTYSPFFGVLSSTESMVRMFTMAHGFVQLGHIDLGQAEAKQQKLTAYAKLAEMEEMLKPRAGPTPADMDAEDSGEYSDDSPRSDFEMPTMTP